MNSTTTLLRFRSALAAVAVAVVTSCTTVGGETATLGGETTLHGYVLDSACAFIKDLDKPISKECAIQCATAGSPLVILADDGTIYWPISNAMPAVGMNAQLLEFAGDRVIVTGKEYMKGGSCGFVIEKIGLEPATKK